LGARDRRSPALKAIPDQDAVSRSRHSALPAGKDLTTGAASPSVTALLVAWSDGDQAALGQLIPIVHAELRRLAGRHMAGEHASHTLQASALVNEAYLRLIEVKRMRWQNRAHFFAMSGRLMRRILVDHARTRRYLKRGGGAAQVSLDEALMLVPEKGRDLIALDDALTALAAVDKRKSEVVELRFFGGLSVAETAEALHVSPETVMRDWKVAKVWLLRELDGDPSSHVD
jgi:RNA polymerase sigma-70 factor (ECF subfamily)